MIVLLVFMFGVVALSIWELKGGPRWRMPVVIGACALIATAFMSLKVV